MPNTSIEHIIYELANSQSLSEGQISKLFSAHPSETGKVYSKSEVLKEFHKLTENKPNLLTAEQQKNFLKNITMKKVRTLSGVTTVTVLTKPFACPGKCIFCPNDVKMPKSYISSEPGAQRAKANQFDPYLQTYNRLLALQKIGHPTDKVELIVLGGTWTAYPENYQIWFIKRCFDAMNDFVPEAIHSPQPTKVNKLDEYEFTPITDANGKINYNLSVSRAPDKSQTATWEELFEVHNLNITAKSRCVGMSIETRPDEITEKTVENIRKLGATKIQLGVQSLDDNVLKLNKRGHDVAQTALAFKLIRQAGFKIHAHYMPNLYGATPTSDVYDFAKLFSDPRFCPDEIKIYPCSLIAGTELMELHETGKWKPYTNEELLYVLSECLKMVPEYCRVTRVIRDIPGQEIVVGNKVTNLRQNVEQLLKSDKHSLAEIRNREIKNKRVTIDDLKLQEITYQTEFSQEIFIEYVTEQNEIAGFLRVSLPKVSSFLSELEDCAIIREVHVYGASLEIGKEKDGAPQHIGLGTKLTNRAFNLATQHGYKKMAVISSIGTRKYYEKFGFTQENLYQIRNLE
jgi:elongator complex protein 3